MFGRAWSLLTAALPVSVFLEGVFEKRIRNERLMTNAPMTYKVEYKVQSIYLPSTSIDLVLKRLNHRL